MNAVVWCDFAFSQDQFHMSNKIISVGCAGQITNQARATALANYDPTS